MSPILGILILAAVALASPPIMSAQQCTTNSECPSSDCCLLGPSRYATPTCAPFQQKGEQCRVNAETITTNLTYPNNSRLAVESIHYILCPCADGLSCEAEIGICN